MTTLQNIVSYIHPSVSGMNVLVSDQIWVVFDRELDEDSIKANFFVTGPDKDTWSGPDLLLYDKELQEGDEKDILSSPDYHGFVQGTFTFEKVNISDLDTYIGWDYGGAGNIWRTKAIFSPSKPLTPSIEYQVHLVGDEDITDDLATGIQSRTIFDTVNGANTGTGIASFVGSYTGLSVSETLTVKVTTAGAAGTARFTWWRASNPLLVFGPYVAYRGKVALADGVSILFTDGIFAVNDTFSSVVKKATIYEGNLTWPFTTGSGSIQELPSSVSTDILGIPLDDSDTGTAVGSFSVLSTSPANRETNLGSITTDDTNIVIVFSSALDAATVNTNTVSVTIDPVNGDDVSYPASGVVTSEVITVSGAALTLTLPKGMIGQNQVVTIGLDADISSTTGTTLGSDYEFYFTSLYSPMYSSWRKLMLEYGAYLGDVPRDTVNFAIFEASLAADNLIWTSTVTTTVTGYFNWVKREFTTCKAAEILLLNALGAGGGLKAKKLADLEVQYDTTKINQGLEKALGCMGKYEATLHGGGVAKRKPSYVVKGSLDPDDPPVGRQWSSSNQPTATAKAKLSGSRRWTSGFYSPSGTGRTGKGN